MSEHELIDPDCKFEAGILTPEIDPGRCEAKGPCVTSCPYDVLAIRIVPAEIKETMSLLGRIKLFVHGGKRLMLSMRMPATVVGILCAGMPGRRHHASTASRLISTASIRS